MVYSNKELTHITTNTFMISLSS